MSDPARLECPRCGGTNVSRASTHRKHKPKRIGRFVFRFMRCRDCGTEGNAASFWLTDDYLTTLVETEARSGQKWPPNRVMGEDGP